MSTDRLIRNLDYLLDIPEKIHLRTANVLKKTSTRYAKAQKKLAAILAQYRASVHLKTTSEITLARSRRTVVDRLEIIPSTQSSSSSKEQYLLYRIIGNDLYPRHNDGQSLLNLQFILENEPTLYGCKKIWILNRIRNPEKQRQLADILDSYRFDYHIIPYSPEEFLAVGWDWDILPHKAFFASAEFRRLSRHEKKSWELAFYRLKNLYLMNNNGARNYALRLGKAHEANWILPWDGNCFVTDQAWTQIRSVVEANIDCDYFNVPMQRVSDNSDLLDVSFTPDPLDEPQLIFSAKASEHFNPSFAYGRRPKVELFWRIGLKGVWDSWIDEPWDQPRRPSLVPAPKCPQAGWVARLHSGVREGHDSKLDGVLSQQSRYSARNLAIRATINQAIYEHLLLEPSIFSDYWRQSAYTEADHVDFDEQVLLSRRYLLEWLSWWNHGGTPPRLRQQQLLGALVYLVWNFKLSVTSPGSVEHISDCALIESIFELLFVHEEYRLKPRLRLLYRPLSCGRLAGTWPCLDAVEQIMLLSDLVVWSPQNLAIENSFLLWRLELIEKLQTLLNHQWLARTPGNLERLKIAVLAFRRHQGDLDGAIDVIVSLLSSLYASEASQSIPNFHRYVLALSSQFGIKCLEHSQDTGAHPFPPLLHPPLLRLT